MATDLASLSIKVENGDVVKATTSLNTMAVAGGKTEAATTRLTRRIALLEIEARNMDAAMQRGGAAMNALEIEARKMDAELNQSARSMALVEIEARKMDAAMTATKQAAFAAEVRKSAAATAELEMRTRKAEHEVEKLGGTGKFTGSALRNAFAALGIGIALREFSQLADTYTNLNSRLRLVTTGTENLAAVHTALFDVAQRTRTSFESTAGLYASLARSTKALGLSQQDLVGITQTVSQSFKLSGASTAETDNAIRQLGQAFASGVLRGDEFNSMAENAPRLQQALADSLGVTIGQLRQMAQDGKLTSDVLAKAFLGAGKTISAEFATMPRTIGGAMQQIRNEILNTIGSMNDMAGASGGIVTAIDAIRGAIGPLARAANVFFGGFAIAAADAGIWMEKLRQKTAELQLGIGVAIRATGNRTIGDALIGNASKVLKDGDDILRLMKAQREELIKNVHAIADAGAVGTTRTPPTPPPVVDPNAAKDLAELQKATDAYYNTLNQHQVDAIKAAGTMRDQNAAMREMVEATKQGPAAIEALTIAQAGDNAVRALGVGVSEKAADAVRREAEERERLAIALGHVKDAQADADREAQRQADEAEREIERQAKELHRTVSRTIEGILTDIDNKKNPFVAIFDNLKRGAIHAISEILATKVEGKVAEFLGIEMPASKQEKAGKDMKEAADKMLRAAELMNGGPSNVAGITVDGGGQPSPAMAQYLQKFLKVGGAAVGGFELGSAIGQTTGNKPLGAIGGAVSGAALGFQVAGPLGAAAGGIAGFIGGILGAGDAARAAAERLRKAKEAFDTAFDAAKAEVAGNQLAIQIAQVHAQYNGLRDALKEATPWLQEFIGKTLGLGTYAEKLAEINRLEQERIQQLTEEAEAMRRYFSQSLDVRILRAQGKTKEADALEFRNRQEQERDEFRRTHDLTDDKTTADDAEVARNFADYNKLLYAQGLELQANTKALTELTTTVRGGPSGFKLNGYIQQYATGLPHPAGPQSPLPWPTLPPGGLTPPSSPTFSSSSTGKVATAPVTVERVEVNLNVSGVQDPVAIGKLAAKSFLAELDKTVAATGGLNTTRAVALNKMTVS